MKQNMVSIDKAPMSTSTETSNSVSALSSTHLSIDPRAMSKAQLTSYATSTATTAARSTLSSGGSEPTALKTAKATALRVLLQHANDSGFLRRRKAKRKAEVIASIAITNAGSPVEGEEAELQERIHMLHLQLDDLENRSMASGSLAARQSTVLTGRSSAVNGPFRTIPQTLSPVMGSGSMSAISEEKPLAVNITVEHRDSPNIRKEQPKWDYDPQPKHDLLSNSTRNYNEQKESIEVLSKPSGERHESRMTGHRAYYVESLEESEDSLDTREQHYHYDMTRDSSYSIDDYEDDSMEEYETFSSNDSRATDGTENIAKSETFMENTLDSCFFGIGSMWQWSDNKTYTKKSKETTAKKPVDVVSACVSDECSATRDELIEDLRSDVMLRFPEARGENEHVVTDPDTREDVERVVVEPVTKTKQTKKAGPAWKRLKKNVVRKGKRRDVALIPAE